LAVRLVQPGADEAKARPWKLEARNTDILFANDLPVIHGTRSAQNRLVGGWSVLGPITVG
jgi:hypothetical protein